MGNEYFVPMLIVRGLLSCSEARIGQAVLDGASSGNVGAVTPNWRRHIPDLNSDPGPLLPWNMLASSLVYPLPVLFLALCLGD